MSCKPLLTKVCQGLEHSEALFELYESVSKGQPTLLSKLNSLFGSLSIEFKEKPAQWSSGLFATNVLPSSVLRQLQKSSNANTGLYISGSDSYLCIQTDDDVELILSLSFELKEQCQELLQSQQFQALLPHVIQALDMSYKLNRQQHDLHSINYVLEHYPLPALAVDNHLNTIFANKIIRQKLDKTLHTLDLVDPSIIRHQARDQVDLLKLCAVNSQRSKLKEALQSCTKTGAPNTHLCTLTVGDNNYPLVIASTSSVPNLFRHYAREGIAWVYLLDADYGQILRSSESFNTLALSLTEKELSALLFEGYSLSDISDRRNVSLQTVRKQLQSALRKTGLENQESLILFLFEHCIQHGLLQN